MSSREKAEEFLKTKNLYQLGDLDTERQHPLTKGLSKLVEDNLELAIDTLKQVDVKALEIFKNYLNSIKNLAKDIEDTHNSGGRVFLCGCGATGRLSLSVEYLWRQANKDADNVYAFMAGGDIALVHAIEGFEDYPEYGAKQLMQLGFSENDLLISSTEGGETPFVIGATQKATEVSKRKPYFLYCNPKQLLIDKVKRSREVLTSEHINSMELYVGPMALSGSTRMQASTVLQLALSLAFFSKDSIESEFDNFIKWVSEFDFSKIKSFIEKESETYLNNKFMIYSVDEFAISAFTDTTERAPTFSLQAFKSLSQVSEQSLTYISVKGVNTKVKAWEYLLGRSANCLEWDNNNKLSRDYLESFDFSENAIDKRNKILNSDQLVFHINAEEKGFSLKLDDLALEVITPQFNRVYQHLCLKIILNTMSTLIMGKLSRYKSNLMTYVKPSNGKLIDRATRYIQFLLAEESIEKEYDEIVYQLFEDMESLKPDEPIVLKTFNNLKR